MLVNKGRSIMFTMVNDARQKQFDWLNAILDATGWNATTLAKKANVHHSTLSKFRSSGGAASLTSHTIAKIAEVSPIPPFETSPPQQARGIARSEARQVELDQVSNTLINSALSTAKGTKNSLELWILESRALELAGYMPGDFLIVDANGIPAAGDPVCVRFPNPRPGEPTAIIRIFEKPFLVAATLDKTLRRPLLIDDNHLQVAGVIVASLRGSEAA